MYPLLAMAAAALAADAPVPAAAPSATAPRGVVFVIGGISGLDPLNFWAPLVLPHAGVPHELRNFPWTHGKGHPIRDLQDEPHLLAKAAELADAVRAVKAADPSRPVYLVGHSAGAAVALAAAAHLPPATLERVVLLSAAVSPGYDLQPALRATRTEIVAINSAWDWFYLSCCTTLLGTADRVYGPSAGLGGFSVPADLDEEGRSLYARVVQVHWQLGELLHCCGGGHDSPCMPLYLSRTVAPWLLP